MLTKINPQITCIILTYNEEKNIKDCLNSVIDICEKIFIVDSFSTDQTLTIARKYNVEIIQHEFLDYTAQRNWALTNLPIETAWVLNLDADHRLTAALKSSIQDVLSNEAETDLNGYMITRRMVFMGKWIKHGGLYPTYHAVLFKKGKGKCEDRLYDQHFLVEGKKKILDGDLIDVQTDSIKRFTERHNKWAIAEAKEQLLNTPKSGQVNGNITGDQMEQRRFFRNWYSHLPIFLRSFAYFFYRYFIRMGFLDGREGLVYHFLQGLWYRFLIDTTIFEIKKRALEEKKTISEILNSNY